MRRVSKSCALACPIPILRMSKLCCPKVKPWWNPLWRRRTPYTWKNWTVASTACCAFPTTPADTRLPILLFELTSWTKASAIYEYDADTRVVSDTHLQPVGPYGAPTDIESLEVKVPSYDGTAVPLSIVHKRGLKLDGMNPTLLDAYGAYGFSSPPGYDPTLLAWYERGGVFAEAHVRGGGEDGEDWHKAGFKLTKPNTWRDFIACAEYLIEHKYTSPQASGDFRR